MQIYYHGGRSFMNGKIVLDSFHEDLLNPQKQLLLKPFEPSPIPGVNLTQKTLSSLTA